MSSNTTDTNNNNSIEEGHNTNTSAITTTTSSSSVQPRIRNSWQFTKEEILSSPSFLDGIAREKEAKARKDGCAVIHDTGLTLKLPQLTIATGTLFFHRFYSINSLKEYGDIYIVGITCLFLAGKVEETPTKLRDVICASHKVQFKQSLDQESKEFKETRERVLHTERVLLMTLGFELTVEHPYKYLLSFIKYINPFIMPSTRTPLAQIAWNFVNDSFRTTLCLQFKPHQVASAAIYLTASMINVPLPQGDTPWWMTFNVDPEDIEEISLEIVNFYSSPDEADKMKGLQSKIDGIKQAMMKAASAEAKPSISKPPPPPPTGNNKPSNSKPPPPPPPSNIAKPPPPPPPDNGKLCPPPPPPHGTDAAAGGRLPPPPPTDKNSNGSTKTHSLGGSSGQGRDVTPNKRIKLDPSVENNNNNNNNGVAQTDSDASHHSLKHKSREGRDRDRDWDRDRDRDRERERDRERDRDRERGHQHQHQHHSHHGHHSSRHRDSHHSNSYHGGHRDSHSHSSHYSGHHSTHHSSHSKHGSSSVSSTSSPGRHHPHPHPHPSHDKQKPNTEIEIGGQLDGQAPTAPSTTALTATTTATTTSTEVPTAPSTTINSEDPPSQTVLVTLGDASSTNDGSITALQQEGTAVASDPVP